MKKTQIQQQSQHANNKDTAGPQSKDGKKFISPQNNNNEALQQPQQTVIWTGKSGSGELLQQQTRSKFAPLHQQQSASQQSLQQQQQQIINTNEQQEFQLPISMATTGYHQHSSQHQYQPQQQSCSYGLSQQQLSSRLNRVGWSGTQHLTQMKQTLTPSGSKQNTPSYALPNIMSDGSESIQTSSANANNNVVTVAKPSQQSQQQMRQQVGSYQFKSIQQQQQSYVQIHPTLGAEDTTNLASIGQYSQSMKNLLQQPQSRNFPKEPNSMGAPSRVVSPEQYYSEVVSELSMKAQNPGGGGGGFFLDVSSSRSVCRRGSESFMFTANPATAMVFTAPQAEKSQQNVQIIMGQQAAQEHDQVTMSKSNNIVRLADQQDVHTEHELTPKRGEENNSNSMTATQHQQNNQQVAQIQKMISVSPYQKGIVNNNADYSNQKNIFSRPKKRMLASTAPADRPNTIISVSNAPFAQPLPDQTHEFNPIREGRQMPLLLEEQSAGNSYNHVLFHLPMNDVTLQPSNKAFSTTGAMFRNDELSQVDQDNILKQALRFQPSNSRMPSSLSKQSHSAAGDGLAMMQHDESMEIDNSDEHLYAVSQQPNKQHIHVQDNYVDQSEEDQSLRVVVCKHTKQAAVDNSEVLIPPLSQKNRKGLEPHGFKEEEPLLRSIKPGRVREETQQMRMRLHSNFTSIDRQFKIGGGLTSDSIPIIKADQTAYDEIDSSQMTNKFELEPRIKRQAQSIINRRRSVRINMQTQGGITDWRDNQSSLIHEENAELSICNTCHERTVRKKDITRKKHVNSRQICLERSVQLNRTVQIMRFKGNHEEEDSHNDGMVDRDYDDHRSLSAHLHYATSSYSSNRFGFKESDQASKSAQSKTAKKIEQHFSRRRAAADRRSPADEGAPSTKMVSNRSRHEERDSAGSLRSIGSYHKKNRKNHLKHNRDYFRATNLKDQSPTDSPRRQYHHYHDKMHQQDHHRYHGSRQLQDKQNYKSGGAGQLSNVSYFSSTKFPGMASRYEQKQFNSNNKKGNSGGGMDLYKSYRAKDGGQDHHNLRSRSRSRLRSRSRGYSSRSRSRPRSPHHQSTTSRRFLPMKKNLLLQEKDSQSAVASNSYRSNRDRKQKDPGAAGAGILVQNSHNYHRCNTTVLDQDGASSAHKRSRATSKRHQPTQYDYQSRINNNNYNHNNTTTLTQRHGREIDASKSSNYSKNSRRSRKGHEVDGENKYVATNSSKQRKHSLHRHNTTINNRGGQNRYNYEKQSFYSTKQQSIGGSKRHHHYYDKYSKSRRDEEQKYYHDMKDAFYSKRQQNNIHSRRNYDVSSSRGKGSLKTHKDRFYHQRDRRSRSRGLSSFSSRGDGRSIYSSYSRGPPISTSLRQSKKFTSLHNSLDSPSNNINNNQQSNQNNGSASAQIDRSKDAGHFEWRKNMILSCCNPVLTQATNASRSRYLVVDHLGDGTFGRALKCVEMQKESKETAKEDVQQQSGEAQNLAEATPDQQTYAVKVVRAVPRYAESAKFEAQILQDLHKQGGCDRGIVYLKETFMNKSKQSYGNVSNMCLVFEPLGKSLYDFIKDNGYKGFEITHVREIAIQALNAIEFLHSIKLTHTDLKPENILLKDDTKETITDEQYFPIQVQNKRGIYGSQKCSDIDDSSYFSGQSQQVRRKWHQPTSCEVKVIDFGGATYEHERHTLIINTRQYRAPEVILENQTWNEKSDIWSMACILIELYTGELFFDTDENLEHLAMIEKQCGPIPLSMAQRCENDQIKRQLHRDGTREEHQYVKNKQKRLRWPAASLRASNRQAVNNMLLLDDIINDKWGEHHRSFKHLLKFMLKIDPKERPSASDCLNHVFLNESRKLSKSTEKTQVSTTDQFESPALKHHNH